METSNVAGLMDSSGGAAQITLAVSLLSLLAVRWPLMHGTILCWRARAATRVPEPGWASKGAVVGGRIAERIREVRASAGSTAAAEPDAFLRDAAKQLVVEEYESSFAVSISMYSNMLPPIGFIGTVCGLALLLYSMHMSDAMLQLGGLAMALSSTIFALIAYAILESIKIHVYGRFARSIDAGLRLEA